ncbi:hypothetical protein [Arthrobacter sp. ZGTC412]|uniref:hypothetical protein n=1 Tax=Arthrobacter sp. ZGTC412 TaxID=2058900 RepID=UPI000CE2C2C7|nr:hypothetical protein [Arthrobacter sp. ZGTC412]
MSIHHTTITAIFDGFNVAAELQEDSELCAAAYALASLDDPAPGAEERFYDSATTLPGDTPDAMPYEVNNRALLTGTYESRLSERLDELYRAEIRTEVEATP